MASLSLQQLLMRFAALLLVAAVHGWAVSAAAVALGDPGPKYDGRRTLNPFTHLDLLGGVGIVLFSLGWIRPIAVDPQQLRSRWWTIVVVLAGIGATVALALLARIVAPLAVTELGPSMSTGVGVFLSTVVNLALWFAIFNFLPLPPLTGGLLLSAASPGARKRLAPYMAHAKFGLAVLIVTGVAMVPLAPLHAMLLQFVRSL